MARESVRRATAATSIKPSERIAKSRRDKIRRVVDMKDPQSVIGNGRDKLADF